MERTRENLEWKIETDIEKPMLLFFITVSWVSLSREHRIVDKGKTAR